MKAPLYTQVHRGVLHLVYANDRKVVRQREETGGNGTRADMEVDVTPVVPEMCWAQVFMALFNLIHPD